MPKILSLRRQGNAILADLDYINLPGLKFFSYVPWAAFS